MDGKNYDLAIRLRHELHRYPELSGHEERTKRTLIGFLKTHTNLDIIDRGKWFYAVRRAGEGKPNIAFRADIDAIQVEETISLPYASVNAGVSHKCGHDGHAAWLAGFALETDKIAPDKNLFLLFQHAEETGDGAAECRGFIRENDITEIYAAHNMSGIPLGSVGVIYGTAHFASRGMTIHMEGTPSHAAEPEKGINPAFAIARIIDAVPGLTCSLQYEGMVLCTIVGVDIGEKAFGISAGRGDLLLTIRAAYERELDDLRKNLEKLSLLLAGEYGLRTAFSYNDSFPETVNNKECCDNIRSVCGLKGIRVTELKESFRASEDFGHFLKLTKGAVCYIGNGEGYPSLHTTSYDFRDENIETAVELFKGLAEM
jgi:amidohydrolase